MKKYLFVLAALLSFGSYAETARDTVLTAEGEQAFRENFMNELVTGCVRTSDNGTLTLQTREAVCRCSAEEANRQLSQQDVVRLFFTPVPENQDAAAEIFTRYLETDLNTIVHQCFKEHIENNPQ